MYDLVRHYPAAYDDTQRVHWIWKSADLGYGPALLSLAAEATPAVIEAATKRLGPRVGPKGASLKDRMTEAYEHLLDWARRGDLESMQILGSSHLRFDRYKLQTIAEAIEWLRKAEAGGHPAAPLELGLTLFEDGPTLKERREGFDRLKRLGQRGDCIALYLVCSAYVYGMPSIEQKRDLRKAKPWVDLHGKFGCDEEADNFPATLWQAAPSRPSPRSNRKQAKETSD
ncbi:MAG: sel1 repeat family protein [Holophagaceae bacterium]|nr:sel1 repeat family protein [Holophagaceae bacterium]